MEKLKLKIQLQKLKRGLSFQAYIIDETSTLSLPISDLKKGLKKVVDGVEVIYDVCDKNTKYGNIRKSKIYIESFNENEKITSERYCGGGGSSYQFCDVHKIKIFLNIDRAMVMYKSDIHSVIPDPHKENAYILTKNDEIRDKIYSLISKSLNT